MNKYSILLPVRNGGEFVKLCVKSILAQTLPNFNLIVLDNCSTDGTTQWISSLQDNRVRLHLSDKPLTIEENWGRITTVFKAEFITLIGHDDILGPNYLAVMDALISAHPNASLYQCYFNFIDNEGKHIRDCKPMAESQLSPVFLRSLLQNKIDLIGTGFMMRSKDYDALGGIPDYPNLLFADFELWVRLTALSYFAVAPSACFSFRLHQSVTTGSPDAKLHKAFGRLIEFLIQLKETEMVLGDVIRNEAVGFVASNCKSLSHRLLRTPLKKRENLQVISLLKDCKVYADKLAPGNNFRPHKIVSIAFADIIDSSALSRSVFLLLKKIYSHPVLK